MEHTRRNRNSTKPLPGRVPVVIKTPNESDLKIFRTLHPQFGFRYLPSNWLHHFCGGYYNDFIKRLGYLKEEQNNYLHWPEQQEYSKNSNYKHGVYGLAPRGAAAIAAPVLPLSKQDYPHELLRSMVEASFAIGAQEAGLRHIGWSELAVHKRVPLTTRTSRYPFSIRLVNGWLKPDGPPIILTRDTADKQYALCIAGKEIDRGTESDATIEKKFNNYAEFIRRKLYTSHYGFDNTLIPFITTSERNMLRLMRLAEATLQNPTWLLFKWLPDYALESRFPKPHGDLVMTPWKRVGHPDFSLATLGAIT